MNVAMGWRTPLENGKCIIEDSTNACVKLDLAMMLFVVPVEQVVGSDFDTPAVEILDTQKQVLSVVTKCEPFNKQHDIFHCHPRMLLAMVKIIVIM